MNIITGKVKSAQKVVLYGPEGIGKTTFASHFPDPLFIDTEGGTKQLDVKRTQAPGDFTMLLFQVRYVVDHPDICKTLVIDTVDWAEQLCTLDVCVSRKKDGIEEFGYGKGYVYLAERFANLLTVLDEVIKAGIHVVLNAHAVIKRFDQPDELGSYDRWQLKLSKQVAPIVKEWADMLLFANYKTVVVNVDGQGAAKGKNKAQGGRRVLYTTHTPSWDAKHRHGFEDEMPFEYTSIATVIEENTPTSERIGTNREESGMDQVEAASPSSDAINQTEAEQILSEPDDGKNPFEDDGLNDPDFKELAPGEEPIPMNLAEIMRHCEVKPEEVQEVVSQKGYYPEGTPIAHYDPDFVAGVLVRAWEQVFGAIKENRKNKNEGEQVTL
ncbi:ATP-binding protein [Eubacterium sp.]|uniref:ATP-binding protein n=1 Tax=Eubacterium sp. TaxID=142586 RepID=UPI002FC62B40